MYEADNLGKFLSQFNPSKHCILLDAYIQSLSVHRQGCVESLAGENFKSLSLVLHDIKSLSLAVGNEELGHKAADIEQDIERGETQAIFVGMDILMPRLDNFIDVIVTYRQTIT